MESPVFTDMDSAVTPRRSWEVRLHGTERSGTEIAGTGTGVSGALELSHPECVTTPLKDQVREGVTSVRDCVIQGLRLPLASHVTLEQQQLL